MSRKITQLSVAFLNALRAEEALNREVAQSAEPISGREQERFAASRTLREARRAWEQAVENAPLPTIEELLNDLVDAAKDLGAESATCCSPDELDAACLAVMEARAALLARAGESP